jgi:PiT family inorganic phosphate transporter
MTFVLFVVFVALVFEYINGFHDTANSIATVVSTKVLTPRAAIILASVTNLAGALAGAAVATTIAKGLVEVKFVTTATIVCALFGGIVWNLLTWLYGLPSSSSHALVGGLVGAAIASATTAGAGWADPLIWAKVKEGAPWFKNEGILYKVVIPMVVSPILGFVVGLLLMTLFYFFLRNWRPATVNGVFGRGQLLSAAYMGWSHGSNDAQKTMGIIALTLAAATASGVLSPEGIFGFLYLPNFAEKSVIPIWIKVTCAVVMAFGTAAGGWRIIKTMGHKMVKLQPVHGFVAETTGATVLSVAAAFGMPVSTTHAITTSIMGVGCAKRWSALNARVVIRILIAWIFTIPATAGIAWLSYKSWLALGLPLN